MADNTTSENIGSINVGIGGDYSPLQQAFLDAQTLAQKAGESISDALVAGGAAGGDLGQEISDQLSVIGPAADAAAGSLDPLAGSIGDVGDAAGGAAPEVGGFSEATQQAGHSAEQAEGGLNGMAEQLLAIGEALAITEGITELGKEALTAADSITHASIALTTIAGSGDAAKETIEGLEQLGMQDGLAMPSLLTAATRMQQLLGPGTDVVSLLGTIANGAAIMGTDIGSAADMFDRMAANGQVMARSLGSVGLTMQGLADAVNKVNPSLGATAVNLTTVFKTMDQADRITALQSAFQGLGGVAEQVANQTFGGQWQQLADAWEGVMVQVGQAILPVISDLVQLTKTDMVPFIQELVSDFNALPTPIKDLAVGVALLTAAVVPVTGALAALGLGLSGLGPWYLR